MLQKRLVVLCALFLAITSVALAQGPPRGARIVDAKALQAQMEAEVDSVIVLLGLEGDLEEQVRAVLNDRNHKMATLREKMRSFRGNRQEMGNARGAIGGLNEETMNKLSELLTEEQLAAYQAFVERNRARRPARRPRQ